MEVVKEQAQLQVETEVTAFCTPNYFTLNTQVPTAQGGGSGPGEGGWWPS